MDPILEKLTTARIGLLLRTPFFGNMATRMKLIDASDWCPTAATNGRDFMYNKKFVEKLSVKKLEFLFAHEICHGIFDHFGRLGSRHPKLANIAQDYAVNQILIDERIGERITEVDICYDSKYRGLAWEEIYDELFGKLEKISMEDLLKMLGDQLDEHIKEEEGAGAGDQDKDGKGKPSLTKAEAEAIRQEIKDAMIQSAAAAGAGKVPAGIQRMIKDLTEPKMDWRTLVQQEIQSIVRNDYSFQRVNRKSMHSGAILPGMKEATTIDVAIAIDMSGSIGEEEASVFLSEVKGILDQYEDFKINLWCFDTEVYNHVEITHDNDHDLLEYVPEGGGGTSFEVNWAFMEEMGIQPKKFIMFTDGYPNSGWGDEDYCDTIFVVKGNERAVSPFGTTVIYEKETASA
jgi:predicted metal-dependent peptidase|tara:strand:- start:3070 stop:4278 length:1209 start_codon:yes stop_codon:yes gene_type:complete